MINRFLKRLLLDGRWLSTLNPEVSIGIEAWSHLHQLVEGLLGELTIVVIVIIIHFVDVVGVGYGLLLGIPPII